MWRFFARLRRWRNWARAAGFITIFTSAIVCSFLWALSNPPTPSSRPSAEQNHASAHTEQQPSDSNQRGTKAVPLAVEIVSPKEGTPEAERQEEDRREKAANERGLVVATWILAVVTGLLFPAAATQAGLFVWQLNYMRKGMDDAAMAAKAAKEAADTAKIQAGVARDTLSIMKDTAERQMRAYVTYSDGQISFSGGSYATSVKVKNSGQTPAYNLTSWIGSEIADVLEGPPIYSPPIKSKLSILGRTPSIN